MPRSAWLVLFLVAPVAFADPPKPVPADHAAKMAKGTELFKARVRAVLAKNCLRCHGGKKTEGDLDLATRGKLLKGGVSGPAVVPGDAKASRLHQLTAHLKEPHMPDGGDKLPDADLKAIADWIDLGAPYDAPLAGQDDATPAAGETAHWAYRPVGNPAPPAVRNATWPRDPIDRFVLAKLEAAGLRPAAPADKRTLVRRVTFDLTGLPPTPEEAEAFVQDNSPDAYAKLIDRLLASPAYGQRWGRHWLDLVRYCDSFDARGFGSDGDCADAWRYRDWVVDAINRDLPYDRFVRMQVAGDVLDLPPNERPAGVVATGMLAIGNWGGGDADKEKLLTDIVDDQIDVVGRSVLGLTVACARCHDHKFDPISTKDYYALAGIFFSTHILPSVGAKTGGPPMLRVPVETPTERAKRAETEAKLQAVERATADTTAKARAVVLARLREELPEHLLAAHDGREGDGLDPRWLRLAEDPSRPPAGAVLSKFALDVAGKKGLRNWRGATDPPSFVVNATGSEAKFATITMPPRTVAVHPGPGTDVAVAWTAPAAGEVEASAVVTDHDANCGDGFAWELRRGAAKLAGGEVGNGRKDAFTGRASVAAGDRLVLVIRRRAEYSCDTTGVEFKVRAAGKEYDLAADWLAATPPTARLGPWSVEEVSPAAPLPAKVAEAAAAWAAARKQAPERAGLEAAARAYAEAVVAGGGVPFLPADGAAAEFFDAAARTELGRLGAEAAAQRKVLAAPRPTANAAQEGGVPGSPHAGLHDVKVHVRGQYDRLGELVPRGFPEMVRGANPPAITSGSGRKELADWLTRPEHPLTARVIVNRVWQYHFGEGIVRTPSNFGALGEKPTHPELLDHLARTFVADGWSLKKLHRRILLSGTYRQSSILDPRSSILQTDPDNRLWGRYPRRRLEAEAIRDSLLAVAGKLDPSRGGPSLRDFASPRRTLYLTTIRSDRTGFGPLFDMADSTAPVDKRTVSTVAPQALFLMNHPFVKQQAEAFADRVLARPEADRLDYAHRVAFGRPPTDAERALGLDVVKPGGREAWAAWCHLLMQANEFVTVE
ncbi:MAG TPA: PSD1 and planctomycete cytochrome C domain-containing protein [Fimbriiglobus sp.]|nr:PSD1 and planctomycete cytochrome C domain-containing protein [Fimbriiglobus sp.]